MKPMLYDPSINNMTPTHKWKCKEEEWDLIHTAWFIQKGFLQEIVNNLRDAHDEQYYSQLEHCLMAYRNIAPFQILEHLNDRWAMKALKDAYYTKWDGNEYLTAFGKPLNDNQHALIHYNIMIVDEDKLQFHLEEMYNSKRFDKNKMLDWERQAMPSRPTTCLPSNTLRRW
jgi:hypothetical protein